MSTRRSGPRTQRGGNSRPNTTTTTTTKTQTGPSSTTIHSSSSQRHHDLPPQPLPQHQLPQQQPQHMGQNGPMSSNQGTNTPHRDVQLKIRNVNNNNNNNNSSNNNNPPNTSHLNNQSSSQSSRHINNDAKGLFNIPSIFEGAGNTTFPSHPHHHQHQQQLNNFSVQNQLQQQQHHVQLQQQQQQGDGENHGGNGQGRHLGRFSRQNQQNHRNHTNNRHNNHNQRRNDNENCEDDHENRQNGRNDNRQNNQTSQENHQNHSNNLQNHYSDDDHQDDQYTDHDDSDNDHSDDDCDDSDDDDDDEDHEGNGEGESRGAGRKKNHRSPRHQRGRRGEKQNTSLYKTEMCRTFMDGLTCPYGDRCMYSHGNDEIRKISRHPRYKTEYCRNFQQGYCKYGTRCVYLHDMNYPNNKNHLTDVTASSLFDIIAQTESMKLNTAVQTVIVGQNQQNQQQNHQHNSTHNHHRESQSDRTHSNGNGNGNNNSQHHSHTTVNNNHNHNNNNLTNQQQNSKQSTSTQANTNDTNGSLPLNRDINQSGLVAVAADLAQTTHNSAHNNTNTNDVVQDTQTNTNTITATVVNNNTQDNKIHATQQQQQQQQQHRQNAHLTNTTSIPTTTTNAIIPPPIYPYGFSSTQQPITQLNNNNTTATTFLTTSSSGHYNQYHPYQLPYNQHNNHHHQAPQQFNNSTVTGRITQPVFQDYWTVLDTNNNNMYGTSDYQQPSLHQNQHYLQQQQQQIVGNMINQSQQQMNNGNNNNNNNDFIHLQQQQFSTVPSNPPTSWFNPNTLSLPTPGGKKTPVFTSGQMNQFRNHHQNQLQNQQNPLQTTNNPPPQSHLINQSIGQPMLSFNNDPMLMASLYQQNISNGVQNGQNNQNFTQNQPNGSAQSHFPTSIAQSDAPIDQQPQPQSQATTPRMFGKKTPLLHVIDRGSTLSIDVLSLTNQPQQPVVIESFAGSTTPRTTTRDINGTNNGMMIDGNKMALAITDKMPSHVTKSHILDQHINNFTIRPQTPSKLHQSRPNHQSTQSQFNNHGNGGGAAGSLGPFGMFGVNPIGGLHFGQLSFPSSWDDIQDRPPIERPRRLSTSKLSRSPSLNAMMMNINKDGKDNGSSGQNVIAGQPSNTNNNASTTTSIPTLEIDPKLVESLPIPYSFGLDIPAYQTMNNNAVINAPNSPNNSGLSNTNEQHHVLSAVQPLLHGQRNLTKSKNNNNNVEKINLSQPSHDPPQSETLPSTQPAPQLPQQHSLLEQLHFSNNLQRQQIRSQQRLQVADELGLMAPKIQQQQRQNQMVGELGLFGHANHLNAIPLQPQAIVPSVGHDIAMGVLGALNPSNNITPQTTNQSVINNDNIDHFPLHQPPTQQIEQIQRLDSEIQLFENDFNPWLFYDNSIVITAPIINQSVTDQPILHPVPLTELGTYNAPTNYEMPFFMPQTNPVEIPPMSLGLGGTNNLSNGLLPTDQQLHNQQLYDEQLIVAQGIMMAPMMGMTNVVNYNNHLIDNNNNANNANLEKVDAVSTNVVDSTVASVTTSTTTANPAIATTILPSHAPPSIQMALQSFPPQPYNTMSTHQMLNQQQTAPIINPLGFQGLGFQSSIGDFMPTVVNTNNNPMFHQ